MALNVISNFAANVAHRNLTMSDAAATGSLAKLSSGTRVVSAKDDAASLAIGSRLRAEVAAMKTASVNAGQAGSMLQIADGALSTISDILVRMKELAVQASSGQFSTIERGVLDSEFQALSSEITRISSDTEFNGTQLIAGAGSTVTQQLATTTELATRGFAITYDTNITTSGDAYRISYNNTGELLSLTNARSGDRVTVDITAALDAVIAARTPAGTPGTNLVAGESVNVQFNSLGITVALNDSFDRTASNGITEGDLSVSATGSTSLTVGTSLTVNYATSSVTNTALTNLLAAGSYAAATGLLTLQVASSGSGNATMAATAGIEFSLNGAAFGATTANFDVSGEQEIRFRLATGGVVLGTLKVDNIERSGATDTIVVDIGELLFGQTTTAGASSSSFTFKVGTGNQTYDSLTFSVDSSSASALGVLGTGQGGLIGITTANLAETASAAVSTAIDTLNQTRATVGAAQNRLTFASSNLATAIENAEAARSNLLDLDVASEISVFTSKQILVQTGVTMLAQANQLPQNLLRLFQ